MTTWGESARLSLVWHKTKQHVRTQVKRLNKEDRKALRSEFSGWFSTDWEDLEIQWMDHYKKW